MILPNASYQEIFRVMREEKPKADFALKKLETKVLKRPRNILVPRHSGVPPYLYDYYEHPVSHNKYLLWVLPVPVPGGRDTAISGAALLVNGVNNHRFVYALQTPAGWTRPMVGDKDILFEYNGHFFSRFRERRGFPDKGPDDTIAMYFVIHQYMRELDIAKINTAHKKYLNAKAWQVDGGIVLGTQWEETHEDGTQFAVLQQKTYLADRDLFDGQRENTISKGEMLFESLMRSYEERGELDRFQKLVTELAQEFQERGAEIVRDSFKRSHGNDRFPRPFR